MRISSKLAALGAAAALVVSATPAGAQPAPAPAAGETPAAVGAAAAATLPSLAEALGPQLTSLVEALQRDLGLTPEEFLDQAGIGQRLSELRPGWQDEFREAFGGVWIDDDGNGVVGVLPGETGDALRDEATGAGFTIQDVALTTHELEARERQVGKIVDGMPEDMRELVTGIRIDPTRNAVVVTTRGGDAATLGNLDSRLADLAEVDMTEAPSPANDMAPFGSLALLNDAGIIPEGPLRTVVDLLSGMTPGTGSIIEGMNETVPNPDPQPAPQGQSRLGGHEAAAPDGPVVGGTGYMVRVPGGECSTGFNGELNGKPVVITAAHCAGEDGTRAAFADGEEFGTMAGVKRDGIDTALIEVDDDAAARFASNLVGTDRDATQPIIGTAAPVVGQKACKTGFRTGFSCGTISQVDANIDVAGSRTIDGAFTVDLCALPGDSGGVVFSGDRALGISSASNVADTGTCANADAVAKAAGFTPRLSAVPIEDVLAAHEGLTLRTN